MSNACIYTAVCYCQETSVGCSKTSCLMVNHDVVKSIRKTFYLLQHSKKYVQFISGRPMVSIFTMECAK